MRSDLHVLGLRMLAIIIGIITVSRWQHYSRLFSRHSLAPPIVPASMSHRLRVLLRPLLERRI